MRRLSGLSVLLAMLSVAPAAAQPYATGPWLATGDIDGTDAGGRETITGPGIGGPPLVKIFKVTQPGPPSAVVPLGPGFLAYGSSFQGGVRVAACDFDPPGGIADPRLAEIVTGPGPGMAPRIRLFRVNTLGVLTGMIADFLAYPANATGGVHVGCGDVDGDGVAEIVVGPGIGGGSQVRVYRYDPDVAGGATLLFEFPAFATAPFAGVRVAAGDVDDDGSDEIIVGRASGAARVRVVSRTPVGMLIELHDFVAHPSDSPLIRLGAGGVFVASFNLDGNGGDEIVTGAGPALPQRVRTFERSPDGSLAMTLNLPILNRLGIRPGIIVGAGRLTTALDSEILTARFLGGSTLVRSFFFIGTPGRINITAY